ARPRERARSELVEHGPRGQRPVGFLAEPLGTVDGGAPASGREPGRGAVTTTGPGRGAFRAVRPARATKPVDDAARRRTPGFAERHPARRRTPGLAERHPARRR